MCPALHRAGEQPPVCHLSLNYQMDSKWLKIALKHFLPTPIREIFCWRLRVRKHLPTCPNTGITWSPAPAVLLKFARQLPVCTLQAPYLASAMWLYSDLWSSGVLLRRLFFQVKYWYWSSLITNCCWCWWRQLVHGQASQTSGEDILLICLNSVKAISIVFLKVSMWRSRSSGDYPATRAQWVLGWLNARLILITDLDKWKPAARPRPGRQAAAEAGTGVNQTCCKMFNVTMHVLCCAMLW